MRRHVSMEQLAQDVLSTAAESARANTKTASAADLRVVTQMAQDMLKLASEIRTSQLEALTYDDVVHAAEARRGKR